MGLGEADTRAKLVDPALHSRGWTEDLIRREETAGQVYVDPTDGRARRRPHGRVDYVLRVKVNPDTQPVAVALIEAKAEHLPAEHGLTQAKAYAAACKRLNVPFVFSSNGHLFVEFDSLTQFTAPPRPLTEFPSPDELRSRYEQQHGFSLASESARPLLARYRDVESNRYYQDAAIRAALEKIAGGGNRVLLALATGSGKTRIAVHLLLRIARAGQLRRALFVCDRDELRTQALGALQNQFGSEVAEVRLDSQGRNAARNARIHVATYQTLGIDREDADATFLLTHYPENYFSHIVIDECHRSAWGKWSEVLRRNPEAVQIGLTATPRTLELTEKTREALADAEISADNIAHFGEPVYEYDMSQGMEDGYLAACEIVQRDIFLDEHEDAEQVTGVEKHDLEGKEITDAITGAALGDWEVKERYEARQFEDRLQLPDRVQAMCADLFGCLLQTGGPEQKTIIFCARDSHAGRVAVEMGNLYSTWCAANGKTPGDWYAFKCTAEASGNDQLPDLRGASRHHFIATTVDLLTTGVDVPCVRNIVFFKYVRSPIAFYQMIGRGTRLHPETGKLMFRIYDYTNATRLFGGLFTSPPPRVCEPGPEPPEPPEPIVQVVGFDVQVTPAGNLVLTQKDGKAAPVTMEEYKELLAAKLVEEAPTLQEFRSHWVVQAERREMLAALPEAGRSAELIRQLEQMGDYDLYDVLAELGYGMAPRTREERVEAFSYKHAGWLAELPAQTREALTALVAQFGRGGTEALESQYVFQTAEVARAGGVAALRQMGKPAEVLQDTKERMFSA
ncbi:MAG: DEAD/DEAH box helicase family protein [Armatimonadota bacterium]